MFVLVYVAVNFRFIAHIILPSGIQFGSTQRRIKHIHDSFVATAKLTISHQQPNHNPSVSDTRVPAANARRLPDVRLLERFSHWPHLVSRFYPKRRDRRKLWRLARDAKIV